MQAKVSIILYILTTAGFLYSQENLKYIRQIDAQGNIKKETLQASTFDAPENVLVLYNINYREDANDNNIWDGFEIAEYYQNKRNIPAENIVAVNCATDPEISRAEYDTYYDIGANVGIKQQVEEILQTHMDDNGVPLRSKIKYIVLTKGIPYKIKYLTSNEYFAADYSSVDASLALIFNGNYNISWHFKNPYYNQDPGFSGTASFIPEFYTAPGSPRLSFLVTRLDGYNVDDVKLMIDRSVRADSTSKKNTFLLDGASKTYDHMESAALTLNSFGAKVYPDPWVDSPAHITTLEDSVIGIVTHGVHAGLPASYITGLYDFKLADGAIFSSYESVNGSSFSENINAGQGQIADFIKIGGSGGIGNVYEPYVSNIADESIFLPAYYSGYTFAEAAYMSIPRVDWTAVVVGDPLMRIASKIQPQENKNFRAVSLKPDILSHSQSIRTVARIVFNEEIDTLLLPDFIVQQTGDTLNHYVNKQNLYLWPDNPLPNSTPINYTASEPLYSVSGDSLLLAYYAQFITTSENLQPLAPYVYDAYPAGIDIDINDDLLFIFSTAMNPETIYPILSTPQITQTHHWIDNSILRVTHPSLRQGTTYSFYMDEHTKSMDDVALAQNYRLNFETGFHSIVYDVDNDGFVEYALNLNNNLLDGYETYADSNGTQTTIFALSDIDNDNQNEFFIKSQQNNFPSWFWNPNAIPFTGYIDKCVIVDDDEDGQNEYAFDFNGTGYFTHVYDPGENNPIRDINFVLLKSGPADGQSNVPAGNSLKLLFSKPVVLNNITENISSAPENNIANIFTAKNGTEVNIQFANIFPAESDISILIKNNISSVTNELLAHDYHIRFHTSSLQTSLPPRVISFYPGDSSKIADNTPTVRFVFSNPMQTNLNTPVITDTANSILWTTYWAASNILYLVPSQQLQGNEIYSFNLSPDLQDQTGRYISGKTDFSFTSNSIEADNNKPTILQVIPDPGNTIASEQSIRIIFSEWITSEPQQWLGIQPQQRYQWNKQASNIYTFKGMTGWKPQSKLDLLVNGSQVNDANFNNSYLSYLLNFFVFGDLVERDIDNDGIKEYVTDNDGNLKNGFELYVDPGGILTYSIYNGDIDGDGFFDFIIRDSTANNLLAWYPAASDSGLIGFCEKTSAGKYDVSVDKDNLVEYTVDTDSLTVKPANPRIRTIEPADGSDNVALFTPLIIQFNMRMDAFSVVQSVAFSFPQAGNWSSDTLDSKFRFETHNGWLPGVVQSLSIKPGYAGFNRQTGKDSINISFRTTQGENNLPGNLSWQFPEQEDSVHSQADYYFAFNQAVDTSVIPEFILLQDFKSSECTTMWYNDTLLKIYLPYDKKPGSAVLENNGSVKFLNTSPLDFSGATNYYISDNLPLSLIRPLFNRNNLLPVSVQLSFLFNQPLDSNVARYISLNRVDGNDTIEVAFDLRMDNNFLTIEPVRLDYKSEYRLKLSKDLGGISGRSLGDEKIFSLFTEDRFTPPTYQVEWQQAEDFLIINWPVPISRQNIFDLFISDDINEKPDTVSYSNLYNTTDTPSWLFDLKKLAQQVYIYIRLRHGHDTFWSVPALADNGYYRAENLISLPLTNELQVDSLQQRQRYIHTISQWSEHIPGWNSSTYLEDVNAWSAGIKFNANKGILARTEKEGFTIWLQNLPQSIDYSDSGSGDKQYQALLNPYREISAGDLAAEFGNITRIAIWDNKLQGWNEAVYDSINNYWLNNFSLHFLQPFYAYATGEFEANINTGGLPKAGENGFPSITKIFHNEIYTMRIYKNGLENPAIVGCGVDSIIHTAYINIANLDIKDNWIFKFYDNLDRFVGDYRFGINGAAENIIPLKFALGAPYPNPFNNEVNIPVDIPAKGMLDIKIFNVLGQLVYDTQRVINEAQKFKYKWQSHNASGVYFIRISFNNKSEFTKVLLIK